MYVFSHLLNGVRPFRKPELCGIPMKLFKNIWNEESHSHMSCLLSLWWTILSTKVWMPLNSIENLTEDKMLRTWFHPLGTDACLAIFIAHPNLRKSESGCTDRCTTCWTWQYLKIILHFFVLDACISRWLCIAFIHAENSMLNPEVAPISCKNVLYSPHVLFVQGEMWLLWSPLQIGNWIEKQS